MPAALALPAALAVPEPFVGPAAAVGTSLAWTASAILFTAAARRLGPTRVNAVRCGVAVALLAATHRLFTGTWYPPATGPQVAHLALSGLVGLSLCDQALFMAFVDAGPRRVQLVMTTSPLAGLLLGALFLGEVVGPRALAGIALTLLGVAWAVRERPGAARTPRTVSGSDPDHAPRRPPAALRRGLVLAAIAAVLQAAGALLGKQGIGHGIVPPAQHLDPLAATYVRMVFGALGLVPLLAWRHLRRRARRVAAAPGPDPAALARAAGRRRGHVLTAAGAVLGPFVGVWLSLVAYDRCPLGVAQTLCSLSPVFILPFAFAIEGERAGPRAVAGALVAVAGSALLFTR